MKPMVVGLFFVLNSFIMIPFAPAAERWSLDRCLHQAFQASRLLQTADLDLRVAESQLGNARALKYPTIGINGAYTRVGKVTSFSIPMGGVVRSFQFGTPDRVNADVRLQWPLFTWGRIRSTLQMARFGIGLNEAQKNQQRLALTEQVIRGYYQVLFHQETISVHEATVVRAQQHLQTALQRFRAGYVSDLDTLRARSQVQNARTTLADAELNLLKSRLAFAKLLQVEAESLRVAGGWPQVTVAIDEDQILKKAWSLRPDGSALELQQQLAEENIRLAGSLNKPNLIAFSGYSLQNGFDPMAPEKFVDNWNVGVQVAISLFDGFAAKHAVEQAQLQATKARLQQTEWRDLVRLQVQTALLGLEQSELKMAAQKQAFALAQAALATAQARYRDGLASSLEVIDAQQALAQSELADLQARFNHLMAKLELCKAMGDYSWFAGD